MAYTYVLTTDVGKVRALTRDTRGPTTVFFQDEEIELYKDLNGGGSDTVTILNTAAQLLDVWATDEAMVTKAVQLLDVMTDGPAVARQLRYHAVLLREQAEALALEGDAGFDTAEMALGPFSLREQITNEALKDTE